MANKPNRRTLDEQIAQARKELEQKEQRVKDLLGRRRTKEDKARTNRLCKRGGQVEKLLPKLKFITDKQFDTFVEKALLSGYAEKILNEIMPTPLDELEGGTGATDSTAAPKPASPAGNSPQASEQGNTPPAQKKADPPHNNGNNNGGGNHHQNGRPAHQQHNNGANGNGNGGNGAHNGG